MHNFQTGIFKTKKRKKGDLAKFFKNPTEAQLNILHECAIQQLGHPPSHHWAHKRIPWKMPETPRHVLAYVAHATRQPKHEFQRRMLDSHDTAKRAAGWASTGARIISDAVEAGASYVNSAAAFIAKHQGTINAAGTLGNIGASIATIGGLIKPTTADRIHSGLDRITTKPKKKTGGAWEDFA